MQLCVKYHMGVFCCSTTSYLIEGKEDFWKLVLNLASSFLKILILYKTFIFSLDNKSDHIRWSVDLRFKVPGENNGMFGLKPDVIMRTKENPDMEIDWETFDSLNRTELQIKSVKDIVDVSTV